jgi:hypothetical protein
MFTKKNMIVIALIAIFVMGAVVLQAADYCKGKVTNFIGSTPHDASVELHIWVPNYGWIELDWVMHNDPDTGEYELCFENLSGTFDVKVTSYSWSTGQIKERYFTWTSGSNAYCDFVFHPLITQ